MTKPGDLPATNWEKEYRKEHKLRQEAEGELTIVKTITIDSSPEMREVKAQIKDLQNSLDRFKKENNECYNRIAEALEVNESHQKFNGKLQERLTELEQEYIEVQAENKKMRNHLEERVDLARKSGM